MLKTDTFLFDQAVINISTKLSNIFGYILKRKVKIDREVLPLSNFVERWVNVVRIVRVKGAYIKHVLTDNYGNAPSVVDRASMVLWSVFEQHKKKSHSLRDFSLLKFILSFLQFTIPI